MAKTNWTKRFLVGGSILVGVLALAWVALLVFVDTEDLKNVALARARDATGYAIEAGPASLHLGFSGVGVRVEDLAASAPDGSQNVDIDALDVYVKIMPLLRKEVSLRSVVLHAPRLVQRPTQAAPGSSAGSDAPEGSPALALLAVDSWRIEGGSFLLEDPERPVAVDGLDAGGSVSWSPEGGAAGEVEGSVESIRSGPQGEATPIGPLRFRTRFDVGADLASARLRDLELIWDPFQVSGEVDMTAAPDGWGTVADLRIESVAWEDLEPLLPPEQRTRLEGTAITGRFAVPELRAAFGPPRAAPEVTGRITFTDVGVRSDRAPTGLSGLSGEVVISPDGLDLPRATGRLGDEALVLSGHLEGLPPRNGTAQVTTRLPAAVLDGFLPPEGPTRLRGGAVAVDLGASTPIPPAGIPSLRGTVDLQELSGSYRDLPLREGRGRIRLEGTRAVVEGLHAGIGGSDVTLDGTMANLAEPWLRFELRSTRLDLDELFPPAEGEAANVEQEGAAIGAPGEGSVRVGELLTRGWRLQDVQARARLAPEGIDLTDITARLYGGTGRGALHIEPAGDAWAYSGNVKAEQVQVGELLAQRFPAARVLTGALRLDADLSGRTGKAGLDAWRALSMTGDVEVADGALLNQPQLEQIGQMLGLSGVSREKWPFQNLLTDFQVEDGNLLIEPLRLRQPGANWTMQGKVGPDGGLALGGSLVVDPARAKLPPELQAVSRYLVDDQGTIPVGFHVGGRLAAPEVQVDWDALARRAADRAKAEQSDALKKKVEENLPDSTTIGNTLQKLFKKGNR